MSSAGLIAPASHGHGHGHGRRGHSRGRFAALPNSVSLSVDQPSTQDYPQAAPVYLNGHAANASASPRDEPHFEEHSSAAQARRASTFENITEDLVTNGRNQETFVAGQTNAGPSSSTGRSTRAELLRGVLMGLPWVILSWHPGLGAADTDLENPAKPSTSEVENHFWQQSCSITAATLFLTGCLQLLLIGGPRSSARFPLLNATNGRTALLRILGIGLPLYAAFNLDSFGVALALSHLASSGFPDSLSGKDSKSSAQERLAWRIRSGAGLRMVLLLLATCIVSSWSRYSWPGYVAFWSSIFLIHPPFHPAARVPQLGSTTEAKSQHSLSSVETASSVEDATLNIFCGAALALMTAAFAFTRGTFKSDSANSAFLTLIAGSFAASLNVVPRGSLSSPHKIGLLVSAVFAAVACRTPLNVNLVMIYTSRLGLAVMFFFVSRVDDKSRRLDTHLHNYSHRHHSHVPLEPSSISKVILKFSEPYPLLHSILKARDSRSIFYFMRYESTSSCTFRDVADPDSLNFAFMLVQLTYGFLTGSLGLLSDSIHMFFDCLALIVGLCAAVMSKWPPSARFPYGYGKVDTLSGFANGIFLM